MLLHGLIFDEKHQQVGFNYDDADDDGDDDDDETMITTMMAAKMMAIDCLDARPYASTCMGGKSKLRQSRLSHTVIQQHKPRSKREVSYICFFTRKLTVYIHRIEREEHTPTAWPHRKTSLRN